MSPSTTSVGTPHVTTVIVSHDGQEWIPRLVQALQAQTRAPETLVAVDTGSTDDSVTLLNEGLGADTVHQVDRRAGFGAAVRAGLDAVAERPVRRHAASGAADDPGNAWIWLLHDDCAPDSHALEALLRVGASDPSIGIVGGRVRAWPRARRLLEIGSTITGTGRRETGLEPGEHDQGQYDQVRDVLGVSTAGLLVRRSVWDQLDGLEPELPLFRDDVDLGWRATRAGHRVVFAPEAVVFHAEAGARGIRTLDAVHGGPHRADRRAALFTVLANVSPGGLAWAYLRLTLGSLLRAAGFLLGKLPRAAADELLAIGSVLVRPGRVAGARRRRRDLGRGDPDRLRAVRPVWWWSYGHGLDALRTRAAEHWRDATESVAARKRRAAGDEESSFDGRPADELSLQTEGGPIRWLRDHPLLAVSCGLTVLALLAGRSLFGGGLLHGGALLPAPDGMGSWWSLYRDSWHDVGLGSQRWASPYVALLLIPATLVLGDAALVVDVILLGAVPLAFVGAYVATGRLFTGRPTRTWTALTYAVLPVVSGAVTSGHLGTVTGLILLPWFVRAAVALLDPNGTAPWRRCFSTGLLLAALVAFVPIAWPMAAVALMVGAVHATVHRRLHRGLAAVAAAVVPLAVLMPWSLSVFGGTSHWWEEAGRIDVSAAGADVAWWELLSGRLGAAGEAPWWLSVGVLILALVALLRVGRLPLVASAWFVALVASVTVALGAAQVITVPLTGATVPVWLGFPTLVAQAALVVAIGFAADSDTGTGRTRHAGPRASGVAVALLAAALPAAGLVWWVGSAPEGSLDRGPAVDLPAYLVEDLEAASHMRVLSVRGGDDGVTYQVVADDGRRLGDETVLPARADAVLTAAVGDLLAQADPGVVTTLQERGVRYVVLEAPADPGYVNQLDGTSGLTRASSGPGYGMAWRVRAGDAVVRPPSGDERSGWLIAQGVAVLICVILAAPGARREEVG